MDIIRFIIENGKTLLAIFGGVVFVASGIVGLTRGTKDDSVIRKILAVMDRLSIFQTEENKKLIEWAREKLKDEDN